ncbi:hypothetical protein HS1genome_2034 [Sulfodiicoccus acidiphilus]|uniref:Amine oxidase domain-containing protein n=1 Tax=Sulfodiicoccus acidiphilus TaxID=1670455 RepID=A0A348B643_9CREN|nr:FAD-dependent oxidoreductase [Sulfodiicoccus acidiphilus]BBD73645.1 hypothetical protein HS1genome_2034 [Sulfodiicoccus acidiphilus]GGU02085.1 hypothetical protein GCM10007116_19010 [Sulfodiicoccus acidiphilus]
MVVGAGIGGLSVAALLARGGVEVEVLEKLSSPGGRARTLRVGEYKFDMGPSWYLMPEVMHGLFRELGRDPSDYFKLKKLNPSFKLKVGERDLEVPSNVEELLQVVHRVERGAGSKMSVYISTVKQMYDLALKKLLYRPFESLIDIIDPEILKEVRSLNLLSSLHNFNRKFFSSDLLLKLVDFSSVFLGGDPYRVPGLYALVNYPVLGQGVFYPEGGFGNVVESLVSLGTELGVTYSYEEEVVGVEVKGDRMSAVRTSKRRVEETCSCSTPIMFTRSPCCLTTTGTSVPNTGKRRPWLLPLCWPTWD